MLIASARGSPAPLGAGNFGERHTVCSYPSCRANGIKTWRPNRLIAAAKRLSKEEAAAGEWAALLSVEDESPPKDGITAEDLNQLCNRGVKLMLSENRRELQDFRDELNVVGKAFTDQEDLDGALFVYALYKMSENVIVDETENLRGVYADAFKTVYSLLEDSGWRLEKEGEESEDGTTLDDIPSLGYMQ